MERGKMAFSAITYFNSIKVRLKLYTVGALVVSPSFQFHKGTIKTEDKHIFAHGIHSFQFHKGTIKTNRHLP